jgi:hypothetical protein
MPAANVAMAGGVDKEDGPGQIFSLLSRVIPDDAHLGAFPRHVL